MGRIGRIDQYASMLANEFDDYSMSENLLIRSEQFNNNDWSKANTTVSTNSTIAPDGTLSGDSVSNTPNVGSSIAQTKTLVNSTTYTFSLYVKPLTANKFLAIEWGNPGTSYSVGNFDLSTLSFSGQGSGTITDVGSGWYRIAHTVTTSATGSVTFNVIYIGAYGTTASSVTLVFWGAQLERSTVATDYTPTVTATVSRVLPSTTNINITGLSTYYASGFSENVGIGSTLFANVFPPYELVYDDFGGTLFGAGQGRYKRQYTDKSVIVYTEIDEVTDFRDIVIPGLVLDLDAGQALSYKTTGTVWTDLSGIGNTASLINGPTYSSANGGTIVFDGTNDAVKIPLSISLKPLNFTFDIWAKTSATTGNLMMFSSHYESFGTLSGIRCGITSELIITGGLRRYYFTTYLNNTRESISSTDPSSYINSWINLSGTWNGTTKNIYLNGQSIGSQIVAGEVHSQLNDFYLGNNSDEIANNNYGNSVFNGSIGAFKFYNRALTAAEILQNYDALKHRFGL
jgi:hypothetical protein